PAGGGGDPAPLARRGCAGPAPPQLRGLCSPRHPPARLRPVPAGRPGGRRSGWRAGPGPGTGALRPGLARPSRAWPAAGALGFPPAVRIGSLTGSADAAADLLAAARLPAGADTLGPVPVGDQERILVRVPRSAGRALADALHTAAGVRSARKAPDQVRIQID